MHIANAYRVHLVAVLHRQMVRALDALIFWIILGSGVLKAVFISKLIFYICKL